MTSIERETGEIFKNPDFLIIGGGEIGSKASQLIEKTPTLKKLGFHTPKRTVLAEGFFNDFFQKSGLGANLRDVSANADTETVVKNSSFSSEQLETLQTICRSYGDKPLVIRSSAKGDARGTGTYKSVFVDNNITDFNQGLKQVLASYFSPDAIAFRKDAATGEGFGVLIEPIIGHDFEGEIAPILSGFGYTSTSRGECHLTIVPGLGCAVESRDGERITKSQIDKYNGILSDYIDDAQYENGNVARRNVALFRTNEFVCIRDAYRAKVFHPYEKEIIDSTIEYHDDIKIVFDNLNLNPVFSAMKKMERAFKKPQYFEWAMTAENGKPVFWIIQIADVDKKLDLVDFENSGEVIFTGHTVTGNGVKEASKIVVCYYPDDVGQLDKFNKENKDYILIYSGNLTCSVWKKEKLLNYRNFSNASVLLEIQRSTHSENPLSHFDGQLDMTGKFFGVLYNDPKIPSGKYLEKIYFNVHQGNFKIIVSENQNKIVIYNQEDINTKTNG